MASMRDIKRRKGSIQSTQQITKAMKLVSTVKLQKARARAENSKPYFEYMYNTVSSMLRMSENIEHPYLTAGASKRKAVFAITSNRGLAGGYNANIVKLIQNSGLEREDIDLYTVGKKGRDIFVRLGYQIKADYSEVISDPLYQDAGEMCQKVLAEFAAGTIGEIYVAYTSFKNTVVHEPRLVKLLPVDVAERSDSGPAVLMNYEPAEEEALNMIIPKYITSILYGTLVEAVASENGARMQAMDSATNNAEEMISSLTLKYNRARQGSITQELTEIIAGADALN